VPDDAIAVVSHAHYDHLDRYTVARLPRSIRWIVPLGLARWFERIGHRNVVELDWWQRVRVDRWSLTCLPAQHWSFRLGQRRDRSLWCSWLIETAPRRFYFAGDSGYFVGFREFGRRFGPIDVAFLPIGTYEPRSHLRYQHMSPAESWCALDDLQAQTLIPMHWGTFQLGWDVTFDAPSALRSVIEREGGEPARTRWLDVGETWLSVGT
jgi:N-acyl-phosphatidylethanolamine-hydrolysing phospholipase D